LYLVCYGTHSRCWYNLDWNWKNKRKKKFVKIAKRVRFVLWIVNFPKVESPQRTFNWLNWI
jgi:hypothetical protein